MNGTARRNVEPQRLFGQGAPLRRRFWADAPGRHQQLQLIRSEVAPQQVIVTCDVRHSAEQGMQVRRGDGVVQLRPQRLLHPLWPWPNVVLD